MLKKLEVRTRLMRYKFWNWLCKLEILRGTRLRRIALRKAVWIWWLTSSVVRQASEDFEEVIL